MLPGKAPPLFRPPVACLCVLALLVGAAAQPLWGAGRLSPQARVSLITAGPGQDLYTLFGHSALRVHDPVTGVDRVYNYGTFDFDQPNFYSKFVRGKLLYKLSAYAFQNMPRHYRRSGRALFEQELLLQAPEVQRLYDALELNARPENAEYLYDFFHDNCASRIRIQVQEALPQGEPRFPELPDTARGVTFRQLITPYIQGRAWLHLGIDLILGPAADETADNLQVQFLPDHMAWAFAGAEQQDADGRWIPLAAPSQLILDGNTTPMQTTSYFPPSLLGGLALLLAALLTLRDYRRRNRSRWFDSLFLLTPGLLGVFYILFWLATDHQVAVGNLNLLWANPLLLVLVTVGLGRARETLRPLALLLALPIVLVWLGPSVLPQEFHPVAQMLATAVFIRLAWFYTGPKPQDLSANQAVTAAPSAPPVANQPPPGKQ